MFVKRGDTQGDQTTVPGAGPRTVCEEGALRETRGLSLEQVQRLFVKRGALRETRGLSLEQVQRLFVKRGALRETRGLLLDQIQRLFEKREDADAPLETVDRK